MEGTSTTLKDSIIKELSRALLLHGADANVMSVVNSYGVTLEDETILQMLRAINRQKADALRSTLRAAELDAQ